MLTFQDKLNSNHKVIQAVVHNKLKCEFSMRMKTYSMDSKAIL